MNLQGMVFNSFALSHAIFHHIEMPGFNLVVLIQFSEFFPAKRPFSFVGITYYVSKTWKNGCRQRKKVASREKIR